MTKRKKYTAEFKREAVRLCEQPGSNVVQIAQELGVSDHSLYKWRKQADEQGQLAFPGKGNVVLTADQQENLDLRKELERVKQERDILKKATMFFAKESK